MFGKRCSNKLNVTLPTNRVPPIRKILRPLKISVGDSFVVINAFLSLAKERECSLRITRWPATVMLEQVDRCAVISVYGDVQRRARTGQSVDVRAARDE